MARAGGCVLDGGALSHIRDYRSRSDAFRDMYGDGGLYRCARCGLVQAAVATIDPDALNAYYRRHYRDIAGIASVKNHASADFFRVRGEAIAALADGAPARVFEMGCGYGYNLVAVRARFPDAETFTDEVDETLDLPPFIRRATIADGPWDLVILSHVLEHLTDPAGVLRSIRAQLAGGGRVLIEVPNEAGDPCVAGADEPHLTFFTGDTLRRTCEAAGYRVADIFTAGPPNPRRIAPGSPRAMLKAILLALPGVKAWRARTRPVRDGSTDLVTRRPNGLYLRAVLHAG